MTASMLKDKIALVTGGAGGIGRAIAEKYASEGASLVVADINQERLDSLEKQFASQGWPLLAIHTDVCDSSQVAAVMQTVEDSFGKLDILVNNVGDFLGRIKPLQKMTDDDIDSLINVNLRQLMICTRDAIPLLKKAGEGASVIAISSIEGYRGMPNITPYGACKLGIEGFVKSMALELAPNIRVNAIAPETTETEQVQPQRWINEQDYQRVKDWVPLGRFGRPDDIAGCALFLASELAAWVSGTVIHCDGGALAAAGWYKTPQGSWTNTPIIEGSGIAGLMPDKD